MCRDRLPELLLRAHLPSETTIQIDDDGLNGQAEQFPVVGVDYVELFKLLDPLGSLYIDVKTLHDEIATLRAGLHQHVNKDKFEDQIAAVKKQAHAIRKGIEQVKADHENTSDPLLKHIARTHHLSLFVWSCEALHQLSALLIDAHDRHKGYLRKELLITSGCDRNITEEELESLLEKPPAVFSQDLLQETNMAKQTLDELRDRHDQFIRLEKSIIDLNQMFQDLAMMVRTQGESIDRIENHMFEASTRTAQAREQMQEAKVSAQSARKKKYILWAVVSSVVIIIIVSLISGLANSG